MSVVPPTRFDPTRDRAWQQLWLASRRVPWTLLAVVPASRGTSTLRAAHALAAVGRAHLAEPIDVVDATALELTSLRALSSDIARRSAERSLTVVALASVNESAPVAAIAKEVDAILLCVRLGEPIADAERVIAELGADRIVGCFVLAHGRRAA